MNWQQLASLCIVALTTVLLVRHEWRRRQRARLRPCGGDCGCSSAQALEDIKSQVQPRFVQK